MRQRPRRSTPRPDPKAHEVDGLLPYMSLINKKPDRHYVLVNRADMVMGEHYYAMMGYEYLLADPQNKDAETIGGRARKLNPGDQMEVMGAVWMWMPMKRRQQIEEYGIDGQGGLDLADRLEEQMGKLMLAEARGPMKPVHAEFGNTTDRGRG